MNCHICNKPAYISVAGVGDFCVDYHNAWMEKTYGVKSEYEYPKDVMIWDPEADKLRSFHLQHINMGHCVSWEALEQPEGYIVSHVSYPGDNPVKVVKDFMAKLMVAVGTKTLDPQGALKDKGSIIPVWTNRNEMGLSIDGKTYSVDAFSDEAWENEWQNILDKVNPYDYRAKSWFAIEKRFDLVMNMAEKLTATSISYDYKPHELNASKNNCIL